MATTNRQRGAVLIMALLLVVVLTMLGVSAMQGAVMEERMAGNAHDHNMAFQSAESGLRDAAAWLLGLAARPDANDTGSNGIYEIGILGDGVGDYAFDWAGSGRDYGTGTSNDASDFSYHAALPAYVVEETAFVRDSLDPEAAAQGQGKYYYTVSSIGYGGSGASEAVAQSVYEKRYN
jgi:type IV pilus assembly protein PilX